MRVAIHQPNYLPWAGYFHKIAAADVFVFLDDAQFPKNSFVNRVKIRTNGEPAWLTVPAKPKLGTPIYDVVPGLSDWPKRHLDRLANDYRCSACFDPILNDLAMVYDSLTAEDLASSNIDIATKLGDRMGYRPRFVRSSSIPNPSALRSDDRLIEIISHVGGTVYFSGSGGSNYQSNEKFEAAGIHLEMTAFDSPPYDQGSLSFEPGLSLVDCLFHTGWDRTADYIRYGR